MISKKFIQSSLIYTLSGALPMASAIILLPFYIAYLPTEVYGVFSLSIAFSALIQVVVTYSFDTSLYIHYHEFKDDHDTLSKFVSSVFIFMLALGIMVALFSLFTGEFIFSFFSSKKTLQFYPYGIVSVGIVSVGIGIFQAIFKVHSNLLQTREKPEIFLWSNIASFSLIALLSILGLKFFPNTLLGPLGSRVFVGFLSTVWAFTRIFKEFGFHPQSPWRLTSFSFNAYTFVYQLQQWTINYLDRFVILFFMPLSTVGIYDFSLKCVAPIELLLNGLNASINPKIVKLITQQTKKQATPEINRYFYGLVSTVLLTICVTIIAIPFFMNIIIKKTAYSSAIQYVPLLALIFIFKSLRLYFVLPYTILKKMKRITILNFSVALIKIGLMILLIKYWHLYGIALSAFIAYAIEILLLWYYLKDDYAMHFNKTKLFGIPCLLLSLILVLEYLFGTSYPLYIHLLYGLVCIILLIVVYRKEILLLDPLKILK